MNASAYAIWHDRFIAYLIDSFILLIPTMILIGLTGSVDAEGKPSVAPVFTLIAFLMQLAYFLSFYAGSWQATPDMRAMNIHLIRLDGRALTQRDGLERFLALVIPSLALQTSFLSTQFAQSLFVFLHIIWFMPVLTTRVGFHDRLTNMRVVNGRIAV